MRALGVALAAVLALGACDSAAVGRAAVDAPTIAPSGQPSLLRRAVAVLPGVEPPLPAMAWGDRAGGDAWTREVLATLESEGIALTSTIPADVATFCPGYASQGPEARRAFWAGLLGALAKYESGWNPAAKGGGGRWLGLMQIAPATWRGNGCSGEILDGGDNLSCAVRIAARTVARDGAIAGGARGLARDWTPMRKAAPKAAIAAFTRRQSYCAPAA